MSQVVDVAATISVRGLDISIACADMRSRDAILGMLEASHEDPSQAAEAAPGQDEDPERREVRGGAQQPGGSDGERPFETAKENMTPQKALEEMKKIPKGGGSLESNHMRADEILCDLLTALGHEEVVDAWGQIKKWYA